MRLIEKRRGVLALLLLVMLIAFSLTAVAGAQEAPPDRAGCIFGQAWFDANRNGVRDASEDAMDGASVALLGLAPFRFNTGPYIIVDHKITRDDGMYEFCGVRPGTYEVRITPPDGVLSGQLFLAAGHNPAGPIPFERDGAAVVNFGFGFPHISDSDDSLNHP